MSDADCTAFLQWALPHLGMRWPGFRKVRAQVCKRVRRRICALDLNGFADYRAWLEADPQEWRALDQCCHITISRFCRDRLVFDGLRANVLPAIGRRAQQEGRQARCWSAGCASGEEPYTLKILWDLEGNAAFPTVGLSITATDIDEEVLNRARQGCYRAATLRDLPPEVMARSFVQVGDVFCVHPRHREGVTFLHQDLRSEAPSGPFDIILCRNLAFTYFAPWLQQQVATNLARLLLPHGYLVVGAHESLPDPNPWFAPVESVPHVMRRVS